MDYQALYRKYRPQRFDEVIGQDHVTKTLSHEVIEGSIAHAYLFAGPRGTGKTTTARLLAKALNCHDRAESGEPCNVCFSCVGITGGSSLDVIELDAASHNKVEDIREIRMNVSTVAATGGSRKVYILDEAHMLSRAAGNALLKTLEEPPEHVIFVLATTEPYKLLDTIRSRSQRFDFHPVGVETLVSHLGDISRREEFDAEQPALDLIASHAAGSVRDAMSLLEQVAALGAGVVRSKDVARALGLADREVYSRLIDSLKNRDAAAALGLVAQLASQGADLRRFVADAIGLLRGIFLAQYAPNLEEVADESSDTLDQWRKHAKAVSPGDVLRAVDVLAEALVQLREGREERLVVELALIRMARPEMSVDAASLASRLGALEDRIRDMTSAPQISRLATDPVPKPAASPAASPPTRDSKPTPALEPVDDDAPTPAEKPKTRALEVAPDAPFTDPEPEPVEAEPVAPEVVLEPVTDLDLSKVEAAWPALYARLRDAVGPSRHAMLQVVAPGDAKGNKIVLHVPEKHKFHLMRLRQDGDLVRVVEATAAEIFGGAVSVAFEHGEVGRDDAGARPDPTRAPEKSDLMEAEDAGIDPLALLQDELGGEVIQE